jgi:hypothetical protein
MTVIKTSKLQKTWFIDLDGTLLMHNMSTVDGVPVNDRLVPGARAFLNSIPKDDIIIITTARSERVRAFTLQQLIRLGVRFNRIIFECGQGERILVNDLKPNGMKTALAYNVPRDGPVDLRVVCDEEVCPHDY